MKRIAVVVACVGVIVAGASCGKGTLGTPTDGGQTGTLAGLGGASIPTGPTGAGGFGAGSGGDGAPAPGVAGFGGSGTGGASGSFGGRGAPGGSGFVTCPPAPPTPACGSMMCGNGRIDRCQVAFGPGCTLTSQYEECDGDQFGGDSCASRGYGSGTLTCSSVCTADDTTCSECLPIGGALVSCGPAPIAFPYLTTFGIAATDTEVGVAQVDTNVNTGTTRLTFARLDRNLGVIGVTGLEDTGQAGPLQNAFIGGVAVAPMPSGWLVAACTGANLFVDVLDASGKKLARTVIDDGSGGTIACQIGTFALAARPTGGALMVWATYYNSSSAVLIAADGLSAGKPQPLVDSQDAVAGYPAGAWIGDAYYVAVPIQLQSAEYPIVVRLLRIAADGTMSKVADILKDEFSTSPAFVAGAGDIRLIYGGVLPGHTAYEIGVMSRRIGPMGQLLSDPVTFGFFPMYYARAPAVAFGDATVALLNGNEHEVLTLVRADASGKISTPQDIAAAPAYPLSMFDLVRRGPDAVVAWMRDGGPLMLARVMP